MEGRDSAVLFYGTPMPNTAEEFRGIARQCRERGYDLWLTDARDGHVVVVARQVPKRQPQLRQNKMLNVLLVVGTLVTTTWAGALHQGVDLLASPSRWAVGLPYALALLSILGIHELGHLLVARRRGVPVTLPYFIPAPFFLGTFGALIRMEGPVEDRRQYLDIAIAGPLAGFIVAVVAVLFGAATEARGAAHGMVPASSFLFAVLFQLAGGESILEPVRLGPIAFAGWLGLLVTALNLVPIGQLDGGHIAYSLLGRRRARMLGVSFLTLMFVTGFLYSHHWLVWGLIAWAVVGLDHPPARNELLTVDGSRHVLAWVALVLFVSIVLPWPEW